MSMLIESVTQLAAQPDGTIVTSADDCGWPRRYAGRRFCKRGTSVRALDADPITGEYEVALLATFKDSLPARVG